MDNNGLSVSDVAALSGGGFGGFGGGFEGLIYLAVIASMFGGGWGGFGFGGNAGAAMAGNLATQNDIQRGFDAQNSAANQREILAAVTAGTAQSVAATNQSFHDVLGIVQDKYGELQRDIAGLAVGQAQQIAAQGECCCSTKMLIAETGSNLAAQIAQNKYENALALAGMEQRITAKMDQNEITSLRDQISQLQLAQATAGVLRFPNQWSYGAGPFPPIFGCPGSANI